MRTLKASDVVQDLGIYPRIAVSQPHVDGLVLALEAGSELPAIVICRKTRKVIDGFHRLNAHGRHHGWESEIAVIEKDYADVREMWLDAIKYNAKHGLPLTASDREACVLKSQKLNIDGDELALAIGVRRESLGLRSAIKEEASLTSRQPVSSVAARHQDDLRLLAAMRNEDESAAEQLLEKYNNLCWKLANKRCPSKDLIDDYCQEARIAFIEGAKRFDESSGVLLITYLHHCIDGHLLTVFNTGGLIRHPRSETGRAAKREHNVISLSARGEDGKALLELGRCDPSVDEDAERAGKLANVRESLKYLSEREREILLARMDGKTLDEIGESLGVSKARVGQIEQRAVERLKRMPSVHSNSVDAFCTHVDWLLYYVNENSERMSALEIEKLTALSMAIDELRAAA